MSPKNSATTNSILLIEDENSVVNFIRKGLTEEGYSVSVALNGLMGEQMAAEGNYSLIILDIMLPDKNGVDVCKSIREKNLNTPILFLTALGTAENIAHALNSGGDDYLAKPFKFIELNARIRALLRRLDTSERMPASGNIFSIGTLKINDDAKTVEKDGALINLTATEYRLLVVLMKNKGKVLSRVDLLESAWDMTFNMGTNVVDVYINYLRKKLDTDPENKLIHTIIGMGYVLKES